MSGKASSSVKIDKWKIFEKVGYKPHSSGQQTYHESEARFKTACCGRRYGKSQMEGHELSAKMFVQNSINWIVAPKYTLGEKEFRVVWNDFKLLGLLPRCKTHYNIDQGRMDIYFPEFDSLLQVKSAERPDGLVGEGIDHVCMSEAAKSKRSTWEMYIRPALQDKHGTADFVSTPQGFNWYKGMYDAGAHPDYTAYESWRFPSWDNPIIFPGGRNDPEILEVESRVSKMFFLQEIAAEFTAFEGQIYEEFDDTKHVRRFDYNPAWKNWWTLDFGYVDPFVCLDIMIDPSDRIWVWREYLVSYKPTFEHGQILKQRANPEGFHVDAICGDPRGADEIATLAWTLGPILAHPVGWVLGVEQVKRLLKEREDGLPGLIIHPSCTELIRQLKALRAKSGREGHNSPEGQHDYDDHGPDALRYFVDEYFLMGANVALKDLYDAPLNRNEAHTFFRLETDVTLNKVF